VSQLDLPFALKLAEGPERTAAVAQWIQSLFENRPPVLAGGAAVELYTAGAYTTGDLDFIGDVTDEVAESLREAGFEREGRHWIHRKAELFVEFPGSALQAHERTGIVKVGRFSVLAMSPEDMIVDRLAAWQFWNSTTDGASALLIWNAQEKALDRKRLTALAERRGVRKGLVRLQEFERASRGKAPSSRDLERWASQAP
jgi:hypothetical protein